MNFLDRTINWFSPSAGLRRIRARTALKAVSKLAYEGAKAGRRTEGWIATGTSANAEVAAALPMLRQRSRDLLRNNPHAVKAINVLVSNAVGTGIIPQARTGNPGLDDLINDAWKFFEQECDADGQLDFYGLQSLAARTVFESGECLIRFRSRLPRDGFRVPIQLQVIEPDFLDSSISKQTPTGYIIQGIEHDLLGRRLAYWLFSQHPGETGLINLAAFTSKPVLASEVLHAYRKERPQQVRGVPWLSPVVLKMRDLDDYEEAELVRKKIEACFAAFVTQPEGAEGPMLATGSTDANGGRLEAFEPGMIEYLKPGEEVSFGNPTANLGYADYSRTQLRAIAAGIGVTYEQLTGDLSNVNYSSYRAGHLEFRGAIDAFRWLVMIPMICQPVWRRFVDIAFTAGLIPEQNYGCRWAPPAYQSIDPQKDADADNKRIRSGVMTWPQAVAAQGYDPDQQLREIAENNAKLDELNIVLDCDPRKTAESGKANQAAPSPVNQRQEIPQGERELEYEKEKSNGSHR